MIFSLDNIRDVNFTFPHLFRVNFLDLPDSLRLALLIKQVTIEHSKDFGSTMYLCINADEEETVHHVLIPAMKNSVAVEIERFRKDGTVYSRRTYDAKILSINETLDWGKNDEIGSYDVTLSIEEI